MIARGRHWQTRHWVALITGTLVVAFFGSLGQRAWTDVGPLEGTVVDIDDGDSLTLRVDRREVRVRLAQIDAPDAGQPWNDSAKRASR